MATGTAAIIPPSRQDPRQVLNTLRKTINYNDAGLSAGLAFDNSIPAGAFISRVMVEIVTAFDGTPTLTIGTNSATYNNLVASGDVDATATGVTDVTRGLGRSIAASADKTPYAMVAATGATQGQAVILIEFDGGWAS